MKKLRHRHPMHICVGVRRQWDLVCDKNYLVETSQSVFNFGVMVGAIIFTSMSDRLGRKPIHLACQYTMLVIGIVIAFAPNYITFVVLRFFLGAVREVRQPTSVENLRLMARRHGRTTPAKICLHSLFIILLLII